MVEAHYYTLTGAPVKGAGCVVQGSVQEFIYQALDFRLYGLMFLQDTEL